MSLALGKSQPWMTRRISMSADVNITLEELDAIAGVLGVSVAKLLAAADYAGASNTNRYPLDSSLPEAA